ncbi:MAG: glycosyltransferase family 2 protein [Kocuria palustris]|uniref:glycosyltransferase n=1 Tax=Kocuria palustris TaxID=71999 RepID=UPI001D2B6CE0|nr:glycosyltransferase family 2 protein [Kocuria palustris]MBZ6375728.1 glycosyltransferase family 2 protein [Kocuria palustris]
MSIIAVVPAVTEPDIDKTLRSLLDQTRAPERIVVAINNAPDDTTAEAAARIQDPRIEVVDLGQITGRKAGALNRAIGYAAPKPWDMVLCMDADTVMTSTWIAAALDALGDGPRGRADAAGAVFLADDDRGWLKGCTAREWSRYTLANTIRDHTHVISGTAALIRFSALERVRARFGHWYAEDAICEDARLTIDLKLTGSRLVSPASCAVRTDVMATVPDLLKQRARWSKGALENLSARGLNATTAVYWRQQALLLASICLFWTFLGISVVVIPIWGIQLTALSVALLAVFVTERVITVWDMGWRHRIAAAALVPEMAYAFLLQLAHVRALLTTLSGRSMQWHHAS